MKHPRTRVAVIDVVALSLQMMEHMPRFSAWAGERSVSSFPPAFPALTCSAQSTYVTGLSPREHAIPGNGWYNRNMCEIQFWKQSNKLVQGPRLWEKLRERYGSGFTCAKLFWWYNMYSTADWTITPRPMYPADGRKIKSTIHWVDAKNAEDAEIRLYDNLFTVEDPDAGDFLELLNPDSLKVLTGCKVEAGLKTAKPGESFQFMRQGYFCVDNKDSAEDHLVFNRSVSLKDGFKKKK